MSICLAPIIKKGDKAGQLSYQGLYKLAKKEGWRRPCPRCWEDAEKGKSRLLSHCCHIANSLQLASAKGASIGGFSRITQSSSRMPIGTGG